MALKHGYSEFEEIQAPAREVIVKTARHLRRAIIDMMNLEPSMRERLLSGELDEPRGPITIVRYLHGTLTGAAEKLAMPDQLHPIIEWRGGLRTVERDTDGKYGFTTNESFTAKIGEGVVFKPGRFEIWDGSSIKDMPKAQVVPRRRLTPFDDCN